MTTTPLAPRANRRAQPAVASFEHGDRLDVGRIDVGQAALIGRAVEHDQRAGARIERTDAADVDRSVRTGLVGGRSQLHAGHLLRRAAFETLETTTLLEILADLMTAADPVKDSFFVAVP